MPIRPVSICVPSGGGARSGRRRVRLLATLAARDEMPRLEGYVANVGAQVDGIVALDDGSADGTGEWLESRPEVLEVIRISADRPAWDEPGNHGRLMEAAARHGADWVIAVDADERLERDFRARAERVIRRGRRLGMAAFAVRVRELWGSPRHFRADGMWGRKDAARLFALRAGQRFDEGALHGPKAPPGSRWWGRYPLADLELYHLRMIDRSDREARRRRYELADPDARFQPGLGYAYLTDERGLELKPLPAGREYVE